MNRLLKKGKTTTVVITLFSDSILQLCKQQSGFGEVKQHILIKDKVKANPLSVQLMRSATHSYVCSIL